MQWGQGTGAEGWRGGGAEGRRGSCGLSVVVPEPGWGSLWSSGGSSRLEAQIWGDRRISGPTWGGCPSEGRGGPRRRLGL